MIVSEIWELLPVADDSIYVGRELISRLVSGHIKMLTSFISCVVWEVWFVEMFMHNFTTNTYWYVTALERSVDVSM